MIFQAHIFQLITWEMKGEYLQTSRFESLNNEKYDLIRIGFIDDDFLSHNSNFSKNKVLRHLQIVFGFGHVYLRDDVPLTSPIEIFVKRPHNFKEGQTVKVELKILGEVVTSTGGVNG